MTEATYDHDPTSALLVEGPQPRRHPALVTNPDAGAVAAAQPRRLHLAASRFERLPRNVTALIHGPDWVHLGEPPIDWRRELREALASRRAGGAIRIAAAWAYRRWKPRYMPGELAQLYSASDFRVFNYTALDRLDFADATFSFAFSEHFFEHLFVDQSIALLKECHRILRPRAVIRTAVPDADLRTYAPPEAPAYPSRHMPSTHHQKHKSRWNVYSLSEALRCAGFRARPVVYCTMKGEFIEDVPAQDSIDYAGCPDREFLTHLGYLRRLPSLIVDAIKPA